MLTRAAKHTAINPGKILVYINKQELNNLVVISMITALNQSFLFILLMTHRNASFSQDHIYFFFKKMFHAASTLAAGSH